MTRLTKPIIFLFLVGLAALTAAIFGALHNQLSYTVGPSYFTDFKFRQFDISSDLPDRIGAAWVGVQASWWMGILVGLPAFLIGLFIVPQRQTYLAAGIGAIGLVLTFTLFAALAGLIGGLVADRTGLLDPYLQLPEHLDRSEFLRAGFMHNASYLGAALGGLIAIWPMFRARRIDTVRTTPQTGNAP